MAYTLEPLPLKNGIKSRTVFLLCRNSKNPLEDFLDNCSDRSAALKMAKAIETVDAIGIGLSRKRKLLRHLHAGKCNDLYEIRTNNCTARAYTFLVDDEEIIVIAFIEQVTHSGTGKRDAERSINKLEEKRPALEEAMKGWGQ